MALLLFADAFDRIMCERTVHGVQRVAFSTETLVFEPLDSCLYIRFFTDIEHTPVLAQLEAAMVCNWKPPSPVLQEIAP